MCFCFTPNMLGQMIPHLTCSTHQLSSSTNLNQRLLCCGFIRYQTTLFAVTLASRLRCIFVKPKTNPTFDRSIHLLEKLTSLLSKRTTVKWLKLFAPLSWNMNYLSQLSGGSNTFSNPPTTLPSIDPSIHSRSRRLPSCGEKPGASRSPRRVGAATECLRRSCRRSRGRPFGEVVGGPVVGRFFVFLGSEKLFFFGGVGWVMFFLGGLVGWLILSCCGGWLKRLTDRWLSFKELLVSCFSAKKVWERWTDVDVGFQQMGLTSAPLFHLLFNMIYHCHCVFLHLSLCGGSVFGKVEQRYVRR